MNKEEIKEYPILNRPMTWCDLIYQSMVEATADKHVWISRYPILDYYGTFPSRISVMSTKKTVYMKTDGKEYEAYPNIDLSFDKSTVSTYFLDTVVMSNLYLKGLGGDYDGDQITVKSVFSQEANAECEKIMHRKSNVLSVCGSNVRVTTNEGIQTIYMLTRFPED